MKKEIGISRLNYYLGQSQRGEATNGNTELLIGAPPISGKPEMSWTERTKYVGVKSNEVFREKNLLLLEECMVELSGHPC